MRMVNNKGDKENESIFWKHRATFTFSMMKFIPHLVPSHYIFFPADTIHQYNIYNDNDINMF